MNIKGESRAGGRELAAHLLNAERRTRPFTMVFFFFCVTYSLDYVFFQQSGHTVQRARVAAVDLLVCPWPGSACPSAT